MINSFTAHTHEAIAMVQSHYPCIFSRASYMRTSLFPHIFVVTIHTKQSYKTYNGEKIKQILDMTDDYAYGQGNETIQGDLSLVGGLSDNPPFLLTFEQQPIPSITLVNGTTIRFKGGDHPDSFYGEDAGLASLINL